MRSALLGFLAALGQWPENGMAQAAVPAETNQPPVTLTVSTNRRPAITVPFLEPATVFLAPTQRPVESEIAGKVVLEWGTEANAWRLGLRLDQQALVDSDEIRITAVLQNLAKEDRYRWSDGTDHSLDLFVVSPNKTVSTLGQPLEERMKLWMRVAGTRIKAGHEEVMQITHPASAIVGPDGEYLIYGVVRIPPGRSQEETEVQSGNLLFNFKPESTALRSKDAPLASGAASPKSSRHTTSANISEPSHIVGKSPPKSGHVWEARASAATKHWPITAFLLSAMGIIALIFLRARRRAGRQATPPL
jgi:hypothetical protein